MLLETLVVTAVCARLDDARRSNDEVAADARVVEMRGPCARK